MEKLEFDASAFFGATGDLALIDAPMSHDPAPKTSERIHSY
jgi:hypothetical protein